MPDESDHEQDPDRVDERETTYWPSDGASLEELVDAAFADAHLTTDLDIPPVEWPEVLGPIAARIDELASQFVSLVGGVVDLSPATGSVAESMRDVSDLARRLSSAIEPAGSAILARLSDIHHSAWDEYQLLLPLSDRISGTELRELVQRTMDIWIATENCIRAMGEPFDPG